MAKGGSELAAPDWKARRSPVNTGAPVALSPHAARERLLRDPAEAAQGGMRGPGAGVLGPAHPRPCPATLLVAWRRVRGNRGSRSAGVDGQTAYEIDVRQGVGRCLGELREEFRAGTFRPLAVK